MFKDATKDEIDQVMYDAWAAFHQYRKYPLRHRAALLHAIAQAIEGLGDELIRVAARETNLPEARLKNERTRTMYQLTTYAHACEQGYWMDVSIDNANPALQPPRPELRKMMVPLGPVLVFGAANFPFAYSTAGGDTASALAAGCPVIVKAHPAHPQTSELMAGALHHAVAESGMPAAVFTHLHGVSHEVGRVLVEHPLVRAIGFTGSFAGGKQIFDWACQRKVPIPVFAEMSSVNPVFLLSEKMKEDAAAIAKMIAGSISLGVGQFCTNPGLLVGLEEDLDEFTAALSSEISKVLPAPMLHAGIYKNYQEKKEFVLSQKGVNSIVAADAVEGLGAAAIATTKGENFIKNPTLQQEVFGPFSLIVRCRDKNEMLQVARCMEGQLTVSLMATRADILQHPELMDTVTDLCGRLIFNAVPTGVEVCKSMQHGGPYPATTDSRFGAVGPDAIKRFVRPLSFQNWPEELLPDHLKNSNPEGLPRTVDQVFILP